jgi:hypothetical protein
MLEKQKATNTHSVVRALSATGRRMPAKLRSGCALRAAT